MPHGKKKYMICAKDALGVIDLQEAFASEKGSLFAQGIPGEPSMDEVIARNNLLVKVFEETDSVVFATQDWHPEDHIEHNTFGKHAVRGTEDAQLIPSFDWPIDRISHEFHLTKGENPDLFSYSIAMSGGFADLITELRRCGVKRIFLSGLAFDYCVGESAIDFVRQGFKVFVVRDATRSVNLPEGSADVMAQKLALYGVELVSFDDIG